MKFVLQQNMWQGFEPIEIELPDNWDVEYHGIEADKKRKLSREEIRTKINSPYGMKPLVDLAKGKKRVAIVFDDISRATPTKILAEIVLEELHSAGIKQDQIRFICALGAHGAHNRRDFVCKLGEKIVREYKVFNHNCYENCIKIGTTKKGYDVCINKEFMSCDLKIGLGAILPHVFNTFGGGGKILFPGLASIETIHHSHKTAINFAREHKIISAATMGDLRVDGMRREVEEMTRMVGEFFKIDCLYNTKQEIVDVFAGDAIEEYYAAIPIAQKLYVTKRAKDKDVIIANANARPNEATIAFSLGSLAAAETGADLVIINHTSMGQVVHYLLGTFGENAPGRMFRQSPRDDTKINRIICFMPNSSAADVFFFGNVEKQIYVDTWEEVMELLKTNHGEGTKVSVLADATMQYYEIKKDVSYVDNF